MTPAETREAERKRHLWEEHIARVGVSDDERVRKRTTLEQRLDANARARARYAADAAYRQRKNAQSTKRAKKRRAWLKANDPEGYAELLRRNREAQARFKAKREAAR